MNTVYKQMINTYSKTNANTSSNKHFNSITHQPFIWETRLVKSRIPDRSIEPCP